MTLCRLLLTTLLNFQILLGVVVYGDYILNITMESYSSDGLCASCRDDNFGCCDNSESRFCGTPGGSSLRCETYFEYCLLSPGTSTASSQPLPCTIQATSDYTIDGAFIDFSQSTVLGLSNPLLLNGISSSWAGVKVQILAMDFDSSGSDDLIDVFRFEITSRVMGSTVIAGTYGLSSLGFKYEVVCADRFYGDTCELFNDCPSPDVCGSNGVCVDGVGDYYCQCDPWYTGSDCSVAISPCDSVNCSGHSQCVANGNSYMCTCDPGYTGEMCDTNINECSGVDCSGQGQCIDGINSYTCVCNAGFTGTGCSVDIDDCAGKGCSGRGRCLDRVNSYVCLCDAGFTGGNCEVDLDYCVGMDCSGQGQCIDVINSYMCICNAGFTGGDCNVDIDDCAGKGCSGQGQCLDLVNSYICDCDAGYTGKDCEIQSGDLGIDAHDHLTLELIVGGTLGGFILLLFLVIFVLIIAVLFFRRRRIRTKKGQATAAVLDKFEDDSMSIDMTKNVVYGICARQHASQEEIYDRRITVDSRGGDPQDINETESYTIYGNKL